MYLLLSFKFLCWFSELHWKSISNLQRNDYDFFAERTTPLSLISELQIIAEIMKLNPICNQEFTTKRRKSSIELLTLFSSKHVKLRPDFLGGDLFKLWASFALQKKCFAWLVRKMTPTHYQNKRPASLHHQNFYTALCFFQPKKVENFSLNVKTFFIHLKWFDDKQENEIHFFFRHDVLKSNYEFGMCKKVINRTACGFWSRFIKTLLWFISIQSWQWRMVKHNS